MEHEHIDHEASTWGLLAKHYCHPAMLLTTIAAATAVLYSGTLLFEFVWDDKAQIVDNPIIRSFGQLHKVFISDLWYHTGRFQLYYRPLFVVWSMLNYALVGLRPWGWHLGAVVMHVAAVIAVFWLVRKLGVEYWTAALATVIFALHPIHIECVAWISAVADSMATLFVAVSFVAFLNARDPGSKHALPWRIASLVLFACALLTKEIALGVCLLVGAYELLYPKATTSGYFQRFRNAVVSALPFAAVAIAYLLLRKVALTAVTGKFDPYHTIADILLMLPYVLTFYLRQLTLPIGLTGLYYTPYATVQHAGGFLVPALALVTVAGLLLFWSRRKNDLLVVFAALWMIIGLAPALYLRSFGDGDFVRDRYIYLGSIGFAILLAKAIRLLPSTKGWSAAAVQGTAVVALVLGYVGMSVAQQGQWDSDLLIYARGHQLYPGNPYTAAGLAREYSRLGASEKAIELAESAVREHPEYGYALLALAETYIEAGRFDAGRVMLQKALLMSPDYAKSERGMASDAGLYARMGDFQQAFTLCNQILAKEPNLYSALYNCGNIYLMGGLYAEAEPLLSHAIKVAPEQAAPKHYLGRALLQDGKNREAQTYLAAAVAMDPGVYDYHYWLGLSLEKSGDTSAAREEYRRALQLNEESVEAKLHLAALEAK